MNTPLRFVSPGVGALVLASVAMLSACGGSDYDHTPPPPAAVVPPTTAVPASASTSIAGFIAYLQLLVVASADMLEPVDTSSVTAPTDETSEPTKVD